MITLARVAILSSWKGLYKQKSHNKQKCIILGNGPSLQDTLKRKSPEFVASEKLCVNGFALSEEYELTSPKYYMIVAMSYFTPDHRLSKLYIDLKKEIFGAIKNKTTWELYMLVPASARKSVDFQQLISSNPNIKPIYFNPTPVEGYDWFKHFMFRRKMGMPRPHNVLIPSLMSLIALGYKELLIVGADHSWLSEISVNENNEAKVHQKHFYDENSSKPTQMHDWSKRPRRLHEILNKFYLSFKGYWEIKKYAESKNVKIYNCSKVSMIDAFERRDLK